MRLDSLLERARDYPIFTIEECRKWFPETTRGTMLLELSQFAKRGKITRVKRGLYMTLSGKGLEPPVIASRIDPLAVIGLESVLARAGIIPEVPFATVAVTTGKTRSFNIMNYGAIHFRHIKPALNFGWTTENFGRYVVRVASPEKALLDLFWYHRFERDPSGYIQELRLTIPKNFSWELFNRYAKIYDSEQIMNLAKILRE